MTSANGGLFDLSGRVALITGGSGGLGLGMALGQNHLHRQYVQNLWRRQSGD